MTAGTQTASDHPVGPAELAGWRTALRMSVLLWLYFTDTIRAHSVYIVMAACSAIPALCVVWLKRRDILFDFCKFTGHVKENWHIGHWLAKTVSQKSRNSYSGETQEYLLNEVRKNYPMAEEKFSEEHLFYKEDGYNGFSDYTVLVSDFIEGGRTPYAVAIHLSYKKDNDEVWVKHFTSISNDDDANIQGKFAEAVEKAVTFLDEKHIVNEATDELRKYYTEMKYPGLGMVKKISILPADGVCNSQPQHSCSGRCGASHRLGIRRQDGPPD